MVFNILIKCKRTRRTFVKLGWTHLLCVHNLHLFFENLKYNDNDNNDNDYVNKQS